MNRQEGPPGELVRSLVEGPSAVGGVEWHDACDSTNDLAWAAAGRGEPEVHVVVTDFQRAGRGRLGRTWTAPPGTSLMCSLLLRPGVTAEALPLLPLLAGLALGEALAPYAGQGGTALKWPNDVLATRGGPAGASRAVGTEAPAGAVETSGGKLAGILAEGPREGAVVVGFGVNVDWRDVSRPAELAAATSLAEASGRDVPRWRVLAACLAVFGNRYDAWKEDPGGFLDGYRARCTTIGQAVRVQRMGGSTDPVQGRAIGVADSGALQIRIADGETVEVSAGDVEHLRPA